ncbi:MAG: ACP S-malonyltransferase [Candidatus Goldbacteria bacterium]|nr:ACP S-malonyltransferase [Candidatus Goldiibacteriota bacterium]
MALAIVFPGQGAQYPGMGFDFYSSNEKAKSIFDKAEQFFGGGLLDVMFKGTEEDLKKTDYTQPAIFTMSVAIYEAMKDNLEKPLYFAGHSLGEYSALYAAGAFDLQTGINLVKLRGNLMQQASEKTKSGMAAVLGLDINKVEELCEKVKNIGYISIANYNCPGQIVISGEISAIDAAEAIAKELGAKRYIKLSVAGAFHSALMQPASDIFKSKINDFEIRDIEIPVIANWTAKEIKTSMEIKEAMINQITAPVKWIDSIEYLRSKSVDKFIEIGPGAVLSGLIKKIDKSVKIYNIDKLSDVDKLQK